MSELKNWSNSAGGNTASAPDGFPEGMRPSQVNDAAREVMAAVRRWYEDADWRDFGDTPTQSTATRFTVVGDLTARYHLNRRVRVAGTTNVYGTINSVTFSSNTAVTFTPDSGLSLSGSLSSVALGFVAIYPSVGVGTYLQIANALSELSATLSAARANLGLGSMATQSADSVAITGGTIAGVLVQGSASFSNGNLFNVHLQSCTLTACVSIDGSFQSASISGGTTTGMNLGGSASISGGTITNVIITGANLGGSASISGGTLTGVNLGGSASISGGTITNVTISAALIQGSASISGGVIIRTVIHGATIESASYSGGLMSNVGLQSCTLTGCTSINGALQSASISRSYIFDSYLQSCTLSGCTITSPIFTSVITKAALLQHKLASGTDGGTFTSGAWRTRPLTREVRDSGNIVTLAANQFTVASGTYRIVASATATKVGVNQLRIQNTTDATTLLIGTQGGSNAGSTDPDTGHAMLAGEFSLSASAVLELQHRGNSTRATDGFGFGQSWGSEVYATVYIEKLT